MTAGNDELDANALILFEKALQQPSGTRKNWVRDQTQSDPALRDYVLALLEHDKTSGSAIHTGQAMLDTLDSTSMPDQIGAYRITKLIGQGGMGAVYLGERVRKDFEHTAAIKVIRRSILSDKLIVRFELERQTLASLTHPNIARLFDGGTTAEGAPYIIMEYVDGAPITEWADTENLSENARLKLFIEAAKAVQYLHQNLIVHRDITPSNALVTRSGEVKLIDLGIAKPYDEDTEIVEGAHSLASLTFTPGFAAPERSKGAQANTLSDIYSLGKLLDALLPKNTDGELHAIIAKTTEIAPADRYSTVGGLIEDLEHFKSGHAVQAYNSTSAYKFKKFLSRNKVGTFLASATAVGLTAAFALTYQQYQKAQTRFTETRELTSFLLDDLSKDLVALPGTLSVRQTVADTSSRYLDILAEAAQTDKLVSLDYAKGRAQLGKLLTEGGSTNLGKPEQGIENFEISVRLLKSLVEQSDASIATRVLLADTQADYGYAVFYHFGDMERGDRLINQSRLNVQKVLETEPENAEALIIEARLSAIKANRDLFAGKDSLPAMAKVQEKLAGIVKRFPEHRIAQRDYARSLRQLAGLEYDRWDFNEVRIVPSTEKTRYDTAVYQASTSVKLFEAMLEKEPVNPPYIFQFVSAIRNEVLLHTLDTKWTQGLLTTPGLLARIGQENGRVGIVRYINIDPSQAKRRQTIKIADGLMDQSDSALRLIAPFEGGTFSHIESVFYNLGTRAHIEIWLKLDIDAGIKYLNQAIAMAEAFSTADPDFRNAHTEIAELLNDKVNALTALQTIYGENHENEICQHLIRASRIWEMVEARWGEIKDYGPQKKETDKLLGQSYCL